MFIQALFICLLANTALVESIGHVIADIVRPNTLSDEAHHEQIRSFWTNERLKAARPLNMTRPHWPNRTTSSNYSVSIGPQSSVSGSIPSYNGRKRRDISATGLQVSTTGRVFWQSGTSLYSCSASVVISNSSDLIATAGHCVCDSTTQTWYNNNNWVFIPAYSDNNAPYGTWSARSFLIEQAYITYGDFNADVAFVALSTLNQQHIQDVVGSQGIGFNQPRLAYIDSFGYPANIDSALSLQSCSGDAQASNYTQNGYVGQGLSCDMGHGCSGGPWLQNVDDSTGVGFVTSVNSFMIDDVPNVINGPYFGSNIESLYYEATFM
jgi:hypothetical protein